MVPLPPSFGGFPWAEVAVLAMAFAWGATLGSFLNVVAYRVPRGESVVTGSSRCPACGMPIQPRDNVPVIGWLLLRGRCRGCQAPIPRRYLAVEIACGGIAAAVAAAELLDGRSLPWLAPTGGHPLDRVLMHRDGRPLASWALHCGVLFLLVARSLLGRSGRGDGRSVVVAVAVVVGVVVALPTVGPPGIAVDGGRWPTDPATAAFTASLAGAAVGWLLPRLLDPAVDGGGLAVLGAAVGWQTVTVVAVVTALARRVSRVFSLCARSQGDPLPTVATAALVGWGPLRTAFMLASRWMGGG